MALQFHHRNVDDKTRDISKMVTQGCSMKRILAEIEKCDCVCANCHHEIHDEELRT